MVYLVALSYVFIREEMDLTFEIIDHCGDLHHQKISVVELFPLDGLSNFESPLPSSVFFFFKLQHQIQHVGPWTIIK